MTEAKSEQLTPEQLTGEVGEVLTSWPLYRVLSYKGKGGHYKHRGGVAGETEYTFAQLPKTLSLHCSECSHCTVWETGECKVYFKPGFGEAKYRCRNCGRTQVSYFFY
jgi:hypothetical protein